jgi:hypothetical protein
MVRGECPPGATVRVREKDGELVIKTIKAKAEQQPEPIHT